MAGKSDWLEQALVYMIARRNDNAAGLGQTFGSSANALYWALHTADPGPSGDQTTNEVTTAMYGNYARKIGPGSGGRWSDSWSVTSGGDATTGNLSPVSAVVFPTSTNTGTGCSATHFSIGPAASGAGNIWYSGPINPPLNIPAATAGIAPSLNTTTFIQEG